MNPFQALILLAAFAAGCAHPGPSSCGGYRFERQPDDRFRLTLSMKAVDPVTWRLDDNGDPDVYRSFSGADVTRARDWHAQLMKQRCLDRGLAAERPADYSPRHTAHLRASPGSEVISPSTCIDAGARVLAVRVWADRVECGYVTPL